MKKILIPVILLVVLLGAGGAYFAFLKDDPNIGLAALSSKFGGSSGKTADGEDYAYRKVYDKALMHEDLRVYKTLKKEFPSEYESLLDALKSYDVAFSLGYFDGERSQYGSSTIGDTAPLMAGYNAGFVAGAKSAREYLSTMPDSKPIENFAASGATMIRRAYSLAAFKAPDADLRTVVDMSLTLHKRVLASEGTDKCNQFALSGPGALTDKFDDYVSDLDLQTAAMLKALAKGKAAETERALPSPEDFDALVAKMKERGMSEEQINIIMQQNVQSPEFCPALIGLVEAMQALDGEAGERLRSNYVRTLAAG